METARITAGDRADRTAALAAGIDLSGYEITFRRNPLLGLWTWLATTPSGSTLAPFGFGFSRREAAERDAMRRIAMDAEAETIDGESLRRRVET